MQLFNLASDKGERKNLIDAEPAKFADLLHLLENEVKNGRCTPGQAVPNDRDVTFLPKGVEMPGR